MSPALTLIHIGPWHVANAGSVIWKSRRMRRFRPEGQVCRFRVECGVALSETKDHHGAEIGIIVLKLDFLFRLLLHRSRRSRYGDIPSDQPNSLDARKLILRSGLGGRHSEGQIMGEPTGQPEIRPSCPHRGCVEERKRCHLNAHRIVHRHILSISSMTTPPSGGRSGGC